MKIEITGEIDFPGMMGLGTRIFVFPLGQKQSSKEKLEQLQQMAEGLSPVIDSQRAVNYSSNMVSLAIGRGSFFAVASYYVDWYDLKDEDILPLLTNWQKAFFLRKETLARKDEY